MKLTIGVPCMDHVPTDFALSFAALATLTGSYTMPFSIVAPRRMPVAMARNMIVEQALGNKSSHLLFLDSDMTFPNDVFYRLNTHAKPIIGAYGCKRRFPIERCGKPLDKWTDTGLCEMENIGMAVCLINMEVFKKLKTPAFSPSEDASEDVAFCTKARWAGLKIWCDVDLSKEIGHIGTHIFQE